MTGTQSTINHYEWPLAWERGISEVGGKAAQLAALARYGCPSAKGIVIPTFDCRQLIPDGLWQAAIDAAQEQRWDALPALRSAMIDQANTETLHQLIGTLLQQHAWLNTALAVRSSAPGEDSKQASFAGIHDSVLNAVGVEQISSAILQVITSVWTVQACAYRQHLNIAHNSAAMAVILMPMLRAQSAGIIFTRHPKSGREDQIVISATKGLADRLVAGETDGEDITIQRNWGCTNWRVISRRASRLQTSQQQKSCLSDAQAIELAQIAIDAAYAFNYSEPWLDIEWVFDGQQFTLVQARPITSKPCYSYSPIQDQGFIWTRGNTREILPYPVTVSETTVMQAAVNHMLSVPHHVVGHQLLEGAQRIAFFQGHAYLNASLIQWEIYEGFGIAPQEVNFIIGGHQACIQAPPQNWRERLGVSINMAKALALYNRARKKGLIEVAAIDLEAPKWHSQNLASLSETALFAELIDRAHHSYTDRSGMCMMQGASGSLMELRKRLLLALPAEQRQHMDAIVAALMTEGEESISAKQAYDMMSLAELAATDSEAQQQLQLKQNLSEIFEADDNRAFAQAYRRFMQLFGHRGNYESYVSRPSWREAPEELHQTLLNLGDTDAQLLRERQAEQQAWAKQLIKEHLPLGQRILIKLLQKQAKLECNQRELARSSFAKVLERCRSLTLELGRRFQQRQILQEATQIFHLSPNEMRAAIEGSLSAVAIQKRILDRLNLIQQWQQHPGPDLVYEGGAATATSQVSATNTSNNAREKTLGKDGKIWEGIAISMTSYEGHARKIHHPSQINDLQQGEIMIAASTDPSWLGLFLKAGGVVVETGGYLSHSAIVARELGIPTIVNIPGILTELNNGDLLRIDGARSCLIRIMEAQDTSQGRSQNTP